MVFVVKVNNTEYHIYYVNISFIIKKYKGVTLV